MASAYRASSISALRVSKRTHWQDCDIDSTEFCNPAIRILGFYRAPPVVGRKVNLEEEVEPIGEKRLMDTFFKEGENGTEIYKHTTQFLLTFTKNL